LARSAPLHNYVSSRIVGKPAQRAELNHTKDGFAVDDSRKSLGV
jgi:hypothetical protein